ncbi:MAG: hypothetical protein KAR06_01230 [Deltaproteobacteria bacterium]|nr:hypothetical protein [Deltaproteobacteria bacterium]
MAMRDRYNRFSDGQDISGNAGTNKNSTDVVDLSASGKDYKGNARVADPASPGSRIVAIVTTALVAAADGCVLTVALYEHTAAASIDSGNLIMSEDHTVNTAGLAAGTKLMDRTIPYDKIDERYIALDYAIATQNLSSGAVDAFISAGGEKRIP